MLDLMVEHQAGIPVLMQRIFPADFGERRTISEGYLNSCSFM
jgi:hypothetical protein